ncbi:Anthocyanidin 3-O-glucosyltransferase [Euphorbia peplus]|nr:Anthocyanidin 3-O-glucosyltransferase [Euphorbia peplus]
MSISRKHVAVLAFPFGSHPRSMFTLLLTMATSAPDITFSFFNTQQSNHSLLQSASRLNFPSNIKTYNIEDGVPLGYHYSDHQHEPIDLFLKAAGEILTRRIQNVSDETGIKFTCIVTDSFFSQFVAEIVEEKMNNIPWIPVWVSLPCFLAAISQIQIFRQWIASGSLDKVHHNLDFVPGLSDLFQMKYMLRDVLSENSNESVLAKTVSGVGDAIRKATAVAINCFEELNPEPLNKHFKSINRDFLHLGIVADLSLNSDSNSDTTGCLSWLDRQPPKSVAYICFGTVVELPDNELQELAEALESTRIPFLWSLKHSLKENYQVALWKELQEIRKAKLLIGHHKG